MNMGLVLEWAQTTEQENYVIHNWSLSCTTRCWFKRRRCLLLFCISSLSLGFIHRWYLWKKLPLSCPWFLVGRSWACTSFSHHEENREEISLNKQTRFRYSNTSLHQCDRKLLVNWQWRHALLRKQVQDLQSHWSKFSFSFWARKNFLFCTIWWADHKYTLCFE